ncbi:MAG: CAP domain-containing protein [Treponema sp.]|nr:CAP domain-containing protein [Treponema sp.]
MSCASYGAGGVVSSNDQTEMGVYVFGNSKYAETTVSYAVNVSGNDTQSLGAGFSLQFPFPVWKITLFPLANIEYQLISDRTNTLRNLGWLRFGGGLDYSITDAFYVRGEFMYAPGLFISFQDMQNIEFFRINPAAGSTIRIGLGWRPGVPITSKKKETPAKTGREQPSQAKTSQPQTNDNPNVNNNSGQDNANPDTARGAYYLSNLEKDIILEINMARTDPKKYAEIYIDPKLGAYAKECYEELIKSESRPVLFPKKGLSQAAKDHVTDTGPKGAVGHDGTDGSSMSSRINRYGTWRSGASENISYGYNTAREIVLQLLIDDGVTSRGHRKNIMDKNSRYVGVATGPHSIYRYMCVQDFAVDYTDK